MAEHDLCVGLGVQRGETLGERDFSVRRVHVAERVQEAFGLQRERAHDGGMPVPHELGAETRREIDVAVAVDVDDVRAGRRRVDDAARALRGSHRRRGVALSQQKRARVFAGRARHEQRQLVAEMGRVFEQGVGA